MSEAVRKLDMVNPESYAPKTPRLLNLMEEAQIKQMEGKEMFVRFNTVELTSIDQEIKMVGLSYKKCTETGSMKLDSPFDLYSRDSFAIQEKIKNLKLPTTCYGVWQKDVDIIVGKEVTDVSGQDDIFAAYMIPAGKYIKVSWNAETFSELVMDAMEKAHERAGVDAFIEANNLTVPEGALHVEVYPHERMCVGMKNGPDWAFTIENVLITPPITEYPQMYTLLSVKEKE